MEKAWASHTTKLFPATPHDTMVSVLWSSTTSYVLFRKGVGPASPRPSIGRGSSAKAPPPAQEDWEEPQEDGDEPQEDGE